MTTGYCARVGLAAVGSVLLGQQGWAQSCAPEWLPGFAHSEFNGQVESLLTFDQDGGGPESEGLFAGGSFSQVGGLPISRVARWDGQRWSAVGTGPNQEFDQGVVALSVFDDGTGPLLYAAGGFATYGTQPARRLARFNGTAWEEVGGGTNGWVSTLYVWDDDGPGPRPAGLYIGGNFWMVGGQVAQDIARWDASGWTFFPQFGLPSGAEAMAAFDDGGGERLHVGGHDYVYKWDGAQWDPLPGPISGTVRDMEVHDDGTGQQLYLAGHLFNYGGLEVRGVVRWNGVTWSAVGGDTNRPTHDLFRFDDGSGPALYAGMDPMLGGPVMRWNGASWALYALNATNMAARSLAAFDEDGPGGAPERLFAGGAYSPFNVLKWVPSFGWKRLGMGLNQRVRAVAPMDLDGPGGAPTTLVTGGDFSTAGSVPMNRIARWDGSTWLPFLGGMLGNVRALLQFDDGGGPALFVGGEFLDSGSATADRIVKWTGASWQSVGGTNSWVRTFAVYDDDGGGPAGSDLYVGGDFTLAGTIPSAYIGRWTGTEWQSLGAGTNDVVMSLAVADLDSGGPAAPALFAGGIFTSAGGGAALRAARWDGQSWSPLGAGLNDWVYGLAAWDTDGSGPQAEVLAACGRFTAAGAAAINHVATWDGAEWTPLGSGLDGPVRALCAADVGDGRKLYAGGEFATAAGVPVAHLARWNGSGWSHVGNGVDGFVWTLGVFDVDDAGPLRPSLVVGGEFTVAGGTVSSERIARWGCSAPSCYADCTADGQLTVSDFGCFQTKFVAGDPYSDCNSDGRFTVQDFGCFQTRFVTGCP